MNSKEYFQMLVSSEYDNGVSREYEYSDKDGHSCILSFPEKKEPMTSSVDGHTLFLKRRLHYAGFYPEDEVELIDEEESSPHRSISYTMFNQSCKIAYRAAGLFLW